MLHDMTALDFFNSLHESTPDPAPEITTHDDAEHLLVNAVSSKQHISPADIRKVLSSVKGKNPPPKLASDMEINGSIYRKSFSIKWRFQF